MKILKTIGIIFLLIIIFFSGYAYRYISTIDSNALITQYVDGKYGPKFYGVEIYAVKNNDIYDVYCKVLVGPQTGFFKYYHDVGVIGTESGLRDITEKYSDIKVDEVDGERFLSIGGKDIISMEKIEKGR